MKWRKYLPLVVLALIPGGMIILFAWAFVWAVRCGDELAEKSRASYAEFCRRKEQEEAKQ
jgi:hypothetical protein